MYILNRIISDLLASLNTNREQLLQKKPAWYAGLLSQYRFYRFLPNRYAFSI